jgi:hypothetical protein
MVPVYLMLTEKIWRSHKIGRVKITKVLLLGLTLI